MPTAPPACIHEVSSASGVPVHDLTTVSLLYPDLVGEPYASTVLLAPHVQPESDSEWAWFAWTWRMYYASCRR